MEVERLIDSIRRECLDHVILINEHHLKQVLRSYMIYHHLARTQLALEGVLKPWRAQAEQDARWRGTGVYI